MDTKKLLLPCSALLDVGVLCRDYPDWARLGLTLSDPAARAAVGTDRVVGQWGTALLWLTCCWLAVALAAVGISQLPGRVGRFGHLISHRLLPAAGLRFIAAASGLTMVMAPTAALASENPASTAPSLASSASQPTGAAAAGQGSVMITWPSDAPAAAPAGPTPATVPSATASGAAAVASPAASGATAPGATAVPSPAASAATAIPWPTSTPAGMPTEPTPTRQAAPTRVPTTHSVPGVTRPSETTSAGATANPASSTRASGARSSVRAATGRRPADSQIVVQPGDSLWLIAAARLDRDHTGEGDQEMGSTQHAIAAEWPRWYAANKAVIGPDPGLLRPGQRLTAPAAEG